MKKVLALASFGAIAIIAYAASVDGAAGDGTASGAENTRGRFRFDVRKFTNDANETRIAGEGRFELLNPNVDRKVLIGFRGDRFESNENNASFGGPGVRTIMTRDGAREIRGRVSVHVSDTRSRENPDGAKDRIAIGFDAPGTEHDFIWRGEVQIGDIRVFHRQG